MKFFADEGLDFPLVAALRQAGYDVVYGAELNPGSAHTEVLKVAFEQNRIIVTKDKDLGELAIRSSLPNVGIILIRIDAFNLLANCQRIVATIKKYKDELTNSFTVIQEDKLRIRPLK